MMFDQTHFLIKVISILSGIVLNPGMLFIAPLLGIWTTNYEMLVTSDEFGFWSTEEFFNDW